jgi:hypothetical protein
MQRMARRPMSSGRARGRGGGDEADEGASAVGEAVAGGESRGNGGHRRGIDI